MVRNSRCHRRLFKRLFYSPFWTRLGQLVIIIIIIIIVTSSLKTKLHSCTIRGNDYYVVVQIIRTARLPLSPPPRNKTNNEIMKLKLHYKVDDDDDDDSAATGAHDRS